MIDLADILDLDDAAAVVGTTPEALRKAAQRGTLRARRVGTATRGVWITTADDAARYRADHHERPDRRR